MKAGTFMQSLQWCCTSCGFTHNGGQPFMECPICEAYKSAFVDVPQHIEAELREEFGDETNTAAARKKRLEMAREAGLLKRASVRGRQNSAVHLDGDSRKYL